MSLTEILDHADQAVSWLHSKHKDKANIEALIRILVNPIQDIETVLIQLDTERLIDTATGEQLNVLGRVVGQLRDGLVDDDYRRYIRARIATNKSKGRWNDLVIVLRLILNDADAVLVMSESNYMTVLIEVTEILLSDDLADILIGFLRDTKSDVVRILLRYVTQAAADTFTLGAVTSFDTVGPVTIPIGTTTINAVSTSGFEDAGSLILGKLTANEEVVTYTSKDADHFYGVSATVNTHTWLNPIHTADSTSQGLEDDASPGTGGLFASVLV